MQRVALALHRPVWSTVARPRARRLDTPVPILPIPPMAGRIRFGTQGWGYDAWVGPFYPEGTRPPDYLTTYARAFDVVEVDSTSYAVPAARTIRDWAARVPEGFTFAVKISQDITHEHRLRGVAGLLDQFTDRARELGAKLGPILVQLGPDFGPAELPALAQFLPLLPRDIRFAVEFRQRGWIHDGIIALLAEHQVALTLNDGRWIPRRKMLELAERPTSDFLYARWMGPDRAIADFSRTQVDRSREMELWSAIMAAVAARGIDVFGFASNHFAGHAPASVREMQRLVGQSPVEPEQMGEQLLLF